MKRSGEATFKRPKVVRTRTPCVFNIFISKWASRYNGVLDILTSKTVPNLVCFVYFDLEMYFAPQRRKFFRHRNFQKWSEPLVFLNILISKCASRPNGVHFFIFHLASWLRTRHFSEPTFRPSGATNYWKNAVFRDFPTFSCICNFFLLPFFLLFFFLLIFLFSLPLPDSAFHLAILSEIWLLNFFRLF